MDEAGNREKIIAAAYLVLAEQGYEQASIKEIARTAEVAPGLIHYYFKNKDQLLIAVLKEASIRYTKEVEQIFKSTTSENLARAALEDTKRRIRQHPEGYRLRYELFAMGLRNPATTSGVSDLLDNARHGITTVLRQILKHRPEDELSALAAIMIASFDGLALQKLTNPDFDVDAAFEMLYQLVIMFASIPH